MYKEPFTKPERFSGCQRQAGGGEGVDTAEGIWGEGTVLHLDCRWVTAYTCQTDILCTEDGDTVYVKITSV